MQEEMTHATTTMEKGFSETMGKTISELKGEIKQESTAKQQLEACLDALESRVANPAPQIEEHEQEDKSVVGIGMRGGFPVAKVAADLGMSERNLMS